MKMVKSLLLGSAAGVVAMAGAQAADLPVKAKPVQYVKICSLYGAGFYYVPGTDMCLKIGGWVRQRIGYGFGGNQTNGAFVASAASGGTGGGGLNNRSMENFTWNTRGYITADSRNQTEFGTVRSYIAIGTNTDNAGGATFSSNRAFIQLAGFTFGLSQSFYDFYSSPAVAYSGGRVNPASDTGDGGQVVWGYTAQFGGGLSASIAAEAPRNAGVINANTAMSANASPTDSHVGYNTPDYVANLRVDQPWGSAQIMAAWHDASGTYYGSNTDSGNPNNKGGFAVGAGLKLLAPAIAAGDYFQAQVNYTQGASAYSSNGATALFSWFDGGVGGQYSLGILSDAVYGGVIGGTNLSTRNAGPASGIELTTTWGVNASYEHFWNKQWRTSVYGAYIATSYNDNANRLLCINGGLYTATNPAANSLCNNDWNVWNIGSRTQFNVTPDTYLGVDVMYQKLETANDGLFTSVTGASTQPTASRTFADHGNWTVRARVHKDFYP